MNETRQALLSATRRCIGRNGLAATTSRDITAEADANLAAITYHFGSKDELVSQALLDGIREWLAPTLAVLGGGGDPSARMLIAIQTLVATFEDHRDEAAIYLQALVHAGQDDALRGGLIELWAELHAHLATDIQSLVDDEELAAWVDPDAMAGALMAVANGLVLQVQVDPDGPPLTEMAAQVGSLMLGARRNT
jgi:AcrR family transcriptional regulator